MIALGSNTIHGGSGQFFDAEQRQPSDRFQRVSA